MGGGASGRNGGQCNNGVAQDYVGACTRNSAPSVRAAVTARMRRRWTRSSGWCARSRSTATSRYGQAQARREAASSRTPRKDRRADPARSRHRRRNARPRRGFAAKSSRTAFYGGLLQKRGGQMHMGKFARGPGERGRAATARRSIEHAVGDVDRKGRPAHTGSSSARGELRAKQVLIATGPSRHGPFGWFRRRIVPVGRFIVVTEPLPAAELARLLPQRRSYYDEPPDAQLLPPHAGLPAAVRRARALRGVGAARPMRRAAGSCRRTSRRSSRASRDARIDYCWGGLVDMTPDRLPRAGEHDGIYYSMGYSGHGTQMSTHMGQCMADVMGGDAAANPWRDFDWPAIPGHYGQAVVPAARRRVLPHQGRLLLSRQTAFEHHEPTKNRSIAEKYHDQGKSMKHVADAGLRLEELTQRGASRRDILRAMAAGGMMSVTGAGCSARAARHSRRRTPKQGGKIRVATQSASAADTLDPAKGALGTDYVRAQHVLQRPDRARRAPRRADGAGRIVRDEGRDRGSSSCARACSSTTASRSRRPTSSIR